MNNVLPSWQQWFAAEVIFDSDEFIEPGASGTTPTSKHVVKMQLKKAN